MLLRFLPFLSVSFREDEDKEEDKEEEEETEEDISRIW